MRNPRILIFTLAFASCAAGPRPDYRAASKPSLPAAPLPAEARAAERPGKLVEVEIEGSSRDESRRPYLLGLAGKKIPSLREDEALRMVSAALNAEGFFPGLAEAGHRPLQIKAKFSQEASRFAFFGGGFRQMVHLEAFDGARLVWEFHAEANGSQEDIRPILPTLLRAGRGFIGTSTAGKKTVSLGEQSPPATLAAPPEIPVLPAKKSARRGLLQQ